MDKVTWADIIYLNFSYVFDTVSDHILIDKLRKYVQDKWTASCAENWLNSQFQIVGISKNISAGSQRPMECPKACRDSTV